MGRAVVLSITGSQPYARIGCTSLTDTVVGPIGANCLDGRIIATSGASSMYFIHTAYAESSGIYTPTVIFSAVAPSTSGSKSAGAGFGDRMTLLRRTLWVVIGSPFLPTPSPLRNLSEDSAAKIVL